ncbi:MAG: sigma-70 family RNA polymerase sigma factor [Flavihumibacter sp.]|nr:sigma-70 family RNA polymerase sigma factor [Flavihumibacter sp.]
MNRIEALKRGDPSITRMEYETNREGFFAFLRKLGASEESLADRYQDAFIILLENIRKGRLDQLEARLSTYLFAIGKYSYFNSKKQPDWIPLDENSEVRLSWDPFTDSLPEGFTEKLERQFRLLGLKCQEILKAFYYTGLKLDEIVSSMGYENKETAKSQKSRCLQQLKKQLRS